MKKSQLRNIIKESIKELMNEQGTCPNGVNSVNVKGMGNDPCYSNNSCYGLTSNFINNMNNGFNNANANPTQQNNGCEWLGNKKTAKRNAWIGLQTSGTAFCVGENPNWQARLFNQRKWIINKLEAEASAGSCPGW